MTFVKEFASKVVIGTVVGALSGYVYEQGRKVGRKTNWLARWADHWEEAVGDDAPDKSKSSGFATDSAGRTERW